MTIIQLHKNNGKNIMIIALLVVALFLNAAWVLSIYNQVVNARHEIDRQNKDIRKAELVNAELKKSLYTITDTKNLEAAAVQQSFILEKNPEYIKASSKHLSATN